MYKSLITKDDVLKSIFYVYNIIVYIIIKIKIKPRKSVCFILVYGTISGCRPDEWEMPIFVRFQKTANGHKVHIQMDGNILSNDVKKFYMTKI